MSIDTLNRSGLAMLASMASTRPSPTCWVDGSLPLFRAMLTLGYDAVEDLLPITDDRVQRDALNVLERAKHQLRELAEDMRETWLCDRRKSCTSDMTEAEWDAVDAFNDELEANTPQLSDAMRRAKQELL